MDAVENREEVGELQLLETSGRNMIMKKGGSLKQKSNQTRRMKVLAFTAYGENNQTGNSYHHTIFICFLQLFLLHWQDYDVFEKFGGYQKVYDMLMIHSYKPASGILKC